jgi:hypothetical protein
MNYKKSYDKLNKYFKSKGFDIQSMFCESPNSIGNILKEKIKKEEIKQEKIKTFTPNTETLITTEISSVEMALKNYIKKYS